MTDPAESIRNDLAVLCSEIGARPVGSEANRRAVAYVTGELETAGWSVEQQEFDCLDWRPRGARLVAAGREYTVHPSPFSPGFDGEPELAAASTLDELASLAGGAAGRCVLLYGEIAREQLFPRNFPFYRAEEHVAIYEAIDRTRPAVVLTASERNPDMAGGIYPLPMIEDGDFPYPSAYLSAEQGTELAKHARAAASGSGEPASVRLTIDSDRVLTRATSPVARPSGGTGGGPLVVLTAHVDSKPDTPGAIDNAAGVAAMLATARLLGGERELPVEIALFNGEEYYSAPGEVAYLESAALADDRVALAINVDGAGMRGQRAAWSDYEVPRPYLATVESAFAGSDRIEHGEPWYQGDHMIFVQAGVPALALTCATDVMSMLLDIAHTERDTVELVDVDTVAEIAGALAAIVTGQADRPGDRS